MDKSSLEFFQELLSIPSPSGFEEQAAKFWSKRYGKFADRIEKDAHGNSMAVLNEKGAPRVMLAGHIDEIGFMVTYISDEGFVSFGAVGGHDRQIIQGMRVNIITEKGKVPGVLGKKPIHLFRGDEGRKVPDIEDLWIDIGAKDGKEAKRMVQIGDAVALDVGFKKFPNNLAVARAFDDKVGAFVAGEVLRQLSTSKPKAAVFAVATVQEEVGLRGARTSTFRIDPNVGVAIDVTHATDYPGMSGKDRAHGGEIKLGKGPAVTRGPNINPKVFRKLIDAGRKHKIPHQVEPATGGTGTDANVMQVSRGGVATGLIGIPNRYMHTPCEMVSLEDVDNAVKLLAAFIRGLGPKDSFIPSEG